MLAMTKPQYRPAPNHQPHIALHVRMGDFNSPPSIDELRTGAKNSRIPVEWYVHMLAGLRMHLGPVPAILFSDGVDEDLAPLLKMPNVGRSEARSAVTDLLSIGQSSLVISSGSGFSFWGAFLGNSPRICFPGQRFVKVLNSPTGLELEPECEDPESLTPDFIDHVRRCLAAR